MNTVHSGSANPARSPEEGFKHHADPVFTTQAEELHLRCRSVDNRTPGCGSPPEIRGLVRACCVGRPHGPGHGMTRCSQHDDHAEHLTARPGPARRPDVRRPSRREVLQARQGHPQRSQRRPDARLLALTPSRASSRRRGVRCPASSNTLSITPPASPRRPAARPGTNGNRPLAGRPNAARKQPIAPAGAGSPPLQRDPPSARRRSDSACSRFRDDSALAAVKGAADVGHGTSQELPRATAIAHASPRARDWPDRR